MKHFLLVSASLILFPIVLLAQQGWVSQTSPLGSEILGAIQFVSSTEGWIGAGNGKLLHTTDAGENWSIVNACGTDTVKVISDPSRSMSFVNIKTGFLIGTLGSDTAMGAVLYKTTDGGASWHRQLLNSWSIGAFVQFVNVNNGWAVVGKGTNLSSMTSTAIIHTTDGGASWTSLTTAGIPYFINNNIGWLINASPNSVSANYIKYTTDGGNSWSTQFTDSTSGGFNALQFVDANNGWVIGNAGKIFRTTNGGTNWSQVTNTGNNSEHKALFFLDAMTGWIGSRENSNQGAAIILHTTDGGNSWTVQSTPFQEGIFSLYFTDSQNGWATSDYGGLAMMKGSATSVQENGSTSPDIFELKQNYPNPFNPVTTIRYRIPESSLVTIKVYDILGREIKELVNEKEQPGIYKIEFDGSKLSSSVYFYRIQAGSYVDTKKMILLK